MKNKVCLLVLVITSIFAVSTVNAAYPYVAWTAGMSAGESGDLGGYGVQEAFDSHFGALGYRADWAYAYGSAQGDAGFQLRNDGHGMWHSGSVAGDTVSPAGATCKQWLAADFGSVQNLLGADIWNLNTYYGARGLKDISISVSADGSSWSTAWTGIVAKADGTLPDLMYDGVTYNNPNAPGQVQYGRLYSTRALFGAPTNAQFVVINIMSHWGDEYGPYYAVDEVKFIVPEPATMTMLGLGLAALLRKRK